MKIAKFNGSTIKSHPLYVDGKVRSFFRDASDPRLCSDGSIDYPFVPAPADSEWPAERVADIDDLLRRGIVTVFDVPEIKPSKSAEVRPAEVKSN